MRKLENKRVTYPRLYQKDSCFVFRGKSWRKKFDEHKNDCDPLFDNNLLQKKIYCMFDKSFEEAQNHVSRILDFDLQMKTFSSFYSKIFLELVTGHYNFW